jgi:radical SAM protein with 4Fe4S-binding SPASM domain
VRCEAAHDSTIDPYGRVFPCNILNLPVGNVREKSFEEIWTSPEMDKVRHIVRHCEEPCWMVCTARSAIKRHLAEVSTWVLVHKLKAHFGMNVVPLAPLRRRQLDRGRLPAPRNRPPPSPSRPPRRRIRRGRISDDRGAPIHGALHFFRRLAPGSTLGVEALAPRASRNRHGFVPLSLQNPYVSVSALPPRWEGAG